MSTKRLGLPDHAFVDFVVSRRGIQEQRNDYAPAQEVVMRPGFMNRIARKMDEPAHARCFQGHDDIVHADRERRIALEGRGRSERAERRVLGMGRVFDGPTIGNIALCNLHLRRLDPKPGRIAQERRDAMPLTEGLPDQLTPRAASCAEEEELHDGTPRPGTPSACAMIQRKRAALRRWGTLRSHSMRISLEIARTENPPRSSRRWSGTWDASVTKIGTALSTSAAMMLDWGTGSGRQIRRPSVRTTLSE